MIRLQHDLLTGKYTAVYHESDYKFNAPHRFSVESVPQKENDPIAILAQITFQEGPIKEFGVNGVCNEDVIAMVIARLCGFQQSEFACRENDIAITKLEEALLWLRKRTIGRESRGIEGTHKI